MLLAAAAMAYSLGAHFQYWGPNVTRNGVSIGTPRVDERLILFFPEGDWRTMVVHGGRYQDGDKSRDFIWKNPQAIGLTRTHESSLGGHH